jgi:hypothetical protein
MFSEDRRFRYLLIREWDTTLPKAAFIGLNPSTADETKDDPTIRRCIGFAKTWGCGGLLMLNIYAFRATRPADMWAAQRKGVDVIGGRSNWSAALKQYVANAGCNLVIAAWGAHGKRRGEEVSNTWQTLLCLAKNADGTPKHPLYIKADTQPIPLAAGGTLMAHSHFGEIVS